MRTPRFEWDDDKAAANMRAEYDFSSARPNPYTNRAKTQTTLRLGVETLAYFKSLSARIGIPYQTLINLYLEDCASRRLEPSLDWCAQQSASSRGGARP